MKRALLLSAAVLSTCSTALAQIKAFPGAEGFGQYATGGRGGEVYIVTNLNDEGPGSFRDAISKPKRTVVFAVSGVIRTGKRLIVSPDITIAGQTAPGEGITIYGNGMSFTNANNTICRGIRVRMGVNGDKGADCVSIATGSNMIFDRMSVTWGRDETFSMSGEVKDITVQNTIIGQGLHSHSCGGLVQTTGGVSLLRNLYIDNHTRNPKVKGLNQFVNNVVYNWEVGAYILGDSAGISRANVVGNYFINGPSQSAAPFTRGNENFHIYADQNWHDSNRNGVLDGAVIPQAEYGVVSWEAQPHDYPKFEVLSPADAYAHVIAHVGPIQPRDAVDSRLIEELKSLGKLGQIIANENDAPINGVTMSTSTAAAAKDSDSDGMPDDWETAHKLNPNDPTDRNLTNAEGYTRLEEYLNELIAKAEAKK